MVLGGRRGGIQSGLALLKPTACTLGLGWAPLVVGMTVHLDAVDGAGGQAELTAGAVHSHHRVQMLEGTHDGVGGAGIQAQGAANAAGLINEGPKNGPLLAAVWVEWPHGPTRQLGKLNNAGLATRWATVDVGLTMRNGLCVGPTGRVATSLALGLRQHRIDRVWVSDTHGMQQNPEWWGPPAFANDGH